MDIFSGDISSLVFKGAIKSEFDEISLDSKMLMVLMELDGKKNIVAVARSLNMNMGTLREVLIRLHDLLLIEVVEDATPTLNMEFYNFFKTQLSLAMGPLAEFLLDDETKEFGGEPTKIPLHRAAELVDVLARQIPRKEKRVAFQQAMVKKIRETKP